MAFDLTIWKEQAQNKFQQLGTWLQRRKNEDAPYLVYGTLCSMSLWPLIEAAKAGHLLPVMLALGGVAGGVGGPPWVSPLPRDRCGYLPSFAALVACRLARRQDLHQLMSPDLRARSR